MPSQQTTDLIASPRKQRAVPSAWLRPPALVAAMVLTVGLIGGAAYWAELRESAAALEDFGRAQAALARSLAFALQPRLAGDRRDAAAGLLAGLAGTERPDAVMVLLRRADERDLRTSDGRLVGSAPLREAQDAGRASLRLRPTEAAALGLPARTAMAGLAWIDGGGNGRWALAVVASAERERDRERAARVRLLVAVGTAACVVLLFGGLALRRQRAELELQHQLDVAELERTHDEALERSARTATLGTMAMGIAHELSTPLSVITARAEQLAARTAADERADRAVRVILEQAARIDQVMRAFLSLARGGGTEVRAVPPATITSGATALVAHRFTRAGVALATDVPAGLPAVHGDQRLLEHALVNLLLNACDASPRGSSVELRVAAGDQVAFEVADAGSGISPDDVARVTEPFFTTKPQGAGTGLGLAIVNEIVKHHRGTLTLTPRQPRGTVARMVIPVGDRRSS